MALILIDGMEDRSSFFRPGSESGATGRYVGRAMTLGNDPATLVVPAADESATFTLGLARTSGIFNVGYGDWLRLCSDSSGTVHLTLNVAADGTLTLYRGTGTGTLLATSPIGVLAIAGRWYYVEMQATLSDTVGAVKVRVDGVEVINVSGVDTKNAGTKTVFDSVVLYGRSGSAWYADDFYLMNGAGDSFLGDIVVETLYPDGNGNANQWIGSDGNSTDNYLLVDEVPDYAHDWLPTVTDYVGSATVGHQDLYTMTNLTKTTGTVVGICHAAYITKSDATTRPVKLVNRGAVDTKSPNREPTMGTWTNSHYTLALNPEGGAPFTIAQVNALQSGVEVA